MKRNIFLLLLFGLVVHQIKTSNFVSSIFWYCPVQDLTHQLFVSWEDPTTMENTYGQNMSNELKFAAYDNASAMKVASYLSGGTQGAIYPDTFFNHGVWFNQALIGPYFSTWGGSSLFITQPHSPSNGANAAQIRLLGLGIQDCTGSIVPSYYNHSYGMLKELLYNNIIFWHNSSTNNGDVSYFDIHKDVGSMWAWLKIKKIGIEQNYINKNSSAVWDWTFITSRSIMTDAANIFYQSFQSSLFTEQIHILNSDFNPPLSNVSGLDATTYFKNNKNYTVYFRLNLITPGRMMTVNANTSLSDCMGLQNTYTHIYSQDGNSACGDAYGF